MTQPNQYYLEAQQQVDALQKELGELIIKLRTPNITIVEEERLALRVQEIERSIPSVWIQAGERRKRAEAKALADKISAKLAADEAAKAAADEAARQERIKATAKAAFLRDGGAPENFELVWPGIKANLAADAALSAARQAMQTEQAGGNIRQAAAEFLHSKYGNLPRGDEFLKVQFQGKAAFGDAFDASPFPPDDVPADAELA